MVTRQTQAAPWSRLQRAPVVNPQFRYRDPATGRFRAATLAEKFELDVMDARALYFNQRLKTGQEYQVFRGQRTRAHFAIRRGKFIDLDSDIIGRQVEKSVKQGTRYLIKELRLTSPVDTGLLRSRWQIRSNAVVNDVPYVYQTEYINRSSKGYIRRAVNRTLNHMKRQGFQVMRQRVQRSAVTIRM